VSKAFILLSHERSGSHLIGEFIATVADFRMYDEVCNPDAVKPTKHTESFFRFRHDALLKDPSMLLAPSSQKHREFVKAYFSYLLSLSRTPKIAVDIKYGHVHNFELFWWPILERPALFNICEQENIRIVHLYRENVVEATVSALVASKRKVWHSWQAGSETAMSRFKLPVHEVVKKARLLEQQTAWFRDWTGKNAKLAITYEQIASELGKGGALDKTITGFLGASLKTPFKPRVQKLTPPLREVVENFEELARACNDAGLARFVA
jgi:hypothetical protein